MGISLPTVRHIALVYQDQMRVEHYRRGEQGFEHHDDDALDQLEECGICLRLDESVEGYR